MAVTIEITLLGTGSPIPDPTRAGPSTLVRAGGQTFLVDCGRGVLMRATAAGVGVNALDALEDHRKSAPGGRIDLAIERRGTELAVVVQDDGPGVPEALLPRVADLFFTTKEVGKGTGLGLSIVHNAVTAHGGRVLLSNAPAGGLRVELLFPIVAPGAGAKDGAP